MKELEHYKQKILSLFSTKSRMVLRRDPYRDWFRILLCATAFLLIVVVVDGYLFYKIGKGEIFEYVDNSFPRVETIDRNILQKTNDYYDNKQMQYSEFKVTPVQVVDPSL